LRRKKNKQRNKTKLKIRENRIVVHQKISRKGKNELTQSRIGKTAKETNKHKR
jgi:hypothetical protein